MYPIDALTEEDKDTIRAYIYEFGHVMPQDIDKVLDSWNKSKTKLFKIMGRKLRISKEIELPVNESLIFRELNKIYPSFTIHWRHIYDDTREFGCDFTKELERYLFVNEFKGRNNESSVKLLFSTQTVYDNKLPTYVDLYFYTRKYGQLKLPRGMKTMKAIHKFCEYCGFFDSVPEGESLYEEFRNKVSDVVTKTKIRGKMVMSIHPLDYITMSDNKCGWSSCLSWNSGCYYGGTVELMNSNLAVVCYLESEKPYSFSSLMNKEEYFIPNKSWRCVYFVHKKILLTGNPYPYYNQNLCDIGLDWLYELVYNNVHWDYKYKKQPYGDMIHRCNNEYTRTNQRYAPWDHNDIIVYTYGLYNDFNCLDHIVNCYRNPVKKNLRLSLSGRGTCLSCGGPLDFEHQKGTSYRYNSDLDFKTAHSSGRLVCPHCDCD